MYALNIYFYNTVNSHYFCWVICAHERKSGNTQHQLTWRSSTIKFVKGFTLKNVQGSLTEILTDSCTLFIHTAGRFPFHMQTRIKTIEFNGVIDSNRYMFLQNERERRKLSSSAVLCKTLQLTDNNQNKCNDFRCTQIQSTEKKPKPISNKEARYWEAL